MPKFLLSLVLVCATTFVWAQDSQQEKLEQRKAQIQQEIRDNEKMLQSVRKKEKSAVNEYLIQANKIKLKEYRWSRWASRLPMREMTRWR